MGMVNVYDPKMESWMELMSKKLAEQSKAPQVPTLESAPSTQDPLVDGIGSAIDSWNKGNWAMEEENNRRAGEGADRTMNLLRMIPSMYEARNSARKANFGLAGMAGQ